MVKINKELLKIMDDYRLFMDSQKEIESPVVVTNEKPNHKSSLYVEGPISGNNHIENVKYNCELREKRKDNYSIALVTDNISDKMLFRMDQGNGTHRNNLPNVVLAEQSVPTPHFHRYIEEGYNIAYQTPYLKEHAQLDIFDGFRVFCEEAKIIGEAGKEIKVEIQREGEIPFEEEIDPLNGINF